MDVTLHDLKTTEILEVIITAIDVKVQRSLSLTAWLDLVLENDHLDLSTVANSA
jgi:hypothetical protein